MSPGCCHEPKKGKSEQPRPVRGSSTTGLRRAVMVCGSSCFPVPSRGRGGSRSLVFPASQKDELGRAVGEESRDRTRARGGGVGEHFLAVTLFSCTHSCSRYRRSQNESRSHQLLCEEAARGPALHHQIHRVWKSTWSRGICAAGGEYWGPAPPDGPAAPAPGRGSRGGLGHSFAGSREVAAGTRPSGPCNREAPVTISYQIPNQKLLPWPSPPASRAGSE